MRSSGVSTRIQTARRSLLAAAACASLLSTIAFTVSWAQNRSLEAGALAAARGLSHDSVQGAASLDLLQRLDTLRDSLQRLADYRNDGAPLSFRWGLYRGNALYPELRRIYFDQFRTLLFAETQTRLLDTLRGLPSKPGPEYGTVYDALKAYLITTSSHEHSTRAFLSPILLDSWSKGHAVDPNRLALAARQFGFYADQLKDENPYDSASDSDTVGAARDYLGQFAGVERVYRAMLSEAARTNPPVDFNRRFPGSAAAVVDPYVVSGAFTKAGWQFMNNAVRNPSRYFAGEQWVLGSQQTAQFDAAGLAEQLRARYAADFLNAWRTYLRSAAVIRYANLADAARKLNLLAGNQSPLLALLALASENTAIGDATLAAAFQPSAAVEPPARAQGFIVPPNQPYMTALLALQSSVEQVAAQPGGAGDLAAEPVLSSSGSAKIAARQIAQGFKPDPDGHVDATVEKLLEDPITQVEGLLRVLGPQELNGKGKALCAALRPVLSKYPFDRSATAEASIAEINSVFRRPDGAFWAFYDSNLQKLVVRQGSQWVPGPSATVRPTAEFMVFLNQVSALSDALYSGGAQDPHFSYALRPASSEGIQNLELSLDAQTLTYAGGAGVAKQFTWQGIASHEAKASVRFGSGPDLVWANSQGPWAIFHFLDKADRRQLNGTEDSLEWTIRIGKDPVTLPNGKPLTVHIDLSMTNLPAILDKAQAPRLVCVSQVARLH
jgi:type VI secretion system protein ImpL